MDFVSSPPRCLTSPTEARYSFTPAAARPKGPNIGALITIVGPKRPPISPKGSAICFLPLANSSAIGPFSALALAMSSSVVPSYIPAASLRAASDAFNQSCE